MSKASAARKLRKLAEKAGMKGTPEKLNLAPEERLESNLRFGDVQKSEIGLRDAQGRLREFIDRVGAKYSENGKYTITNLDVMSGEIIRVKTGAGDEKAPETPA